jgi:aspartate/methionine/tyrosine aminotransferase
MYSARGDALVGQEMFKVLDRARQIEQDGNKVYHLELGNPRNPPPEEIIEGTVRALRNMNVGYTSSGGLWELREAIAERYKGTNDQISADQVVVSPANLLISQFLDLTCDQGDRVVVFSPSFPSYLAAAAHIGLEIVEVGSDPEDRFEISIAHVERAIAQRPRAIIVNSANNPTGAVYRQEVLSALAEACEQKGIWLLSDETYGDLCYNREFWSLSRHKSARTVVISSFSKVFSIPGFRLGYALASKEVADKLTLSNSTLISCMPAFTQTGVLQGMNLADEYIGDIRENYAKLAAKCVARINESGLLQSQTPHAGFYLFLDMGRTGLDGTQFADRLLQDFHTAVTPGSSFGDDYSRFIRLAFCGEANDVKEGIERMLTLTTELCT